MSSVKREYHQEFIAKPSPICFAERATLAGGGEPAGTVVVGAVCAPHDPLKICEILTDFQVRRIS
jgi:hypothetical protein